MVHLHSLCDLLVDHNLPFGHPCFKATCHLFCLSAQYCLLFTSNGSNKGVNVELHGIYCLFFIFTVVSKWYRVSWNFKGIGIDYYISGIVTSLVSTLLWLNDRL